MKLGIYYIGFLLLFILSSCNSVTSKKELFNHDWQFIISDMEITDIEQEKNWETVSLPHTPVIEEKVMSGQWQGICWYKKTFEIPAAAKNQRLILHFEGAMNASDFWVNGVKVASNLGGYLPVVFDFTDVAKFGEKNTILVQLNNLDNAITGPKPMRDLDFNMFGGIYRDVFLETKNKLYISDPIQSNKIAGGGIFVSYPMVTNDSAIISIKTNVVNKFDKNQKFILQHEIWDNDILVKSYISDDISLEKNSDDDYLAEIKLDNLNLWSPQSPFLYTLKTKLISKNRTIEERFTRIGIRNIVISKEGFVINGEKIFLRGVNRHQEYPYVGYALSNQAQYRDAVKIKEAGFDYVRLSHYPHSNSFMDACDELGIVVIDAILGWQYFQNNSAFKNQQYESARKLIRRDRNHPSVIAWELSLNESWMPEGFIETLVQIGHEEYPGNQCYVAGWMEYGYDIYLQARQHRLGHYKESDKPYVVSEYGDWEYYAMNAGLNQGSWSDLLQEDRSSRQLLADGELRLLQQATNIQEAHNDNFNTTAFADGYWVMFDYNRGYSNDLESSGIMSIDRLPKFSYYFYQSQRDACEKSKLFKSGPMVKIASWWTPESPSFVKVFSNCDEVELFLNGISLGKQIPDVNSMSTNLNHPPFTFKLKSFEKGELIAKAYLNENLVAQDIVRTPDIPAGLQIEIDYSGKNAIQNCNDVLFIYAKIVDKNGTVVRLNNQKVNFEIYGDAELISPSIIQSEAGIAAALMRIGKNKSVIKIRATNAEFSVETELNKPD